MFRRDDFFVDGYKDGAGLIQQSSLEEVCEPWRMLRRRVQEPKSIHLKVFIMFDKLKDKTKWFAACLLIVLLVWFHINHFRKYVIFRLDPRVICLVCKYNLVFASCLYLIPKQVLSIVSHIKWLTLILANSVPKEFILSGISLSLIHHGYKAWYERWFRVRREPRYCSLKGLASWDLINFAFLALQVKYCAGVVYGLYMILIVLLYCLQSGVSTLSISWGDLWNGRSLDGWFENRP